MPLENQQPMPSEADVYKLYGTKVLHSLLAGAAVGAGGMGIWRTLKNVKNEREREQKKQQSIISVAEAPPSFMPNKLASSDAANLFALPVTGMGAGALIGALSAEKGKRWRSALTGGALGGGIGLAGAAASPGFAEAVGRTIPDEITDILPFQKLFPKEKYSPPTSTYQAAAYLAPIVGGTVGAVGGAKAVQALTKEDKAEENKNTVQKARDDYFKTLLNEEEDKEKTAFSAELDAHYAAYKKQSNTLTDAPGVIGGWLTDAGRWLTPPDKQKSGPFDQGATYNYGRTMLAIPQIVGGIALLSGGAVGAKHMYDKTRNESRAKLYAAAAKARERLRATDNPWVDPVELASIKEISRNKAAYASRG